METVLKVLTDYKLHEKKLVFNIPYLNKEDKVCIATTYSFLKLNEKEVIKEMLHIEKENPNFKSWISYQQYKKL